MSSNPPPPPITPNANTNANFTPDDNAPPRVDVVTQASQLTQEFNLVSTPAAQQRNRNNLREEFLDFQEEHILEHANTETTPIMEPSTVPHFPTPTNHSPDTSNKRIHSVMETTMKNIDRAAAARSMVALSNSAGKKRYTPPKTSLLTFLRSEDIANHASMLDTAGKPMMNASSTSSTLKLAKRAWFNDSTIKTKDKKFKEFRTTKMDVLCERGLLSSALNKFYNRLLLEDLMGIERDKELVLIHQSHSYVSGSSKTWWSRRIKTIGDDHIPEHLNYIVFQSNLYWALRVVVVSNPQLESLHNRVHIKNEIV